MEGLVRFTHKIIMQLQPFARINIERVSEDGLCLYFLSLSKEAKWSNGRSTTGKNSAIVVIGLLCGTTIVSA